ncbi:MAG TPA: PAS domain-containing protein, partial [Opitutus sp.]|nr:PAS domain-containing protein [Opitutus sp.]
TWIWELESDRVFADENLTRWYRLSPDVAHGGPFAAYLQPIHTDDVADVSETIQRALSGDETVQVEYRIPGDAAPWRWVVARARIERNANGQPVRLVGVVLDVTEQRQISQALQVVEERLSLAAEAAEIGSFSWSMPPGDIVSNARCKKHFWLPPDAELTPEKLYAMVHPQDRHPAHQAIDEAIEKHTSFDGEYRTVSPHGQIRWVRVKGRAYYDARGNAIRFDGITLDNTRQRQIEAELQGSEARYRLLVESLEDYAVFMQDDDGNVTSWNTGAERLLGYAEQEILGHSARILFTPEDQARGEFEKEIRGAKSTGRANDDRWHVRKDGSRFFVTGMMVALYDDQGQRIGLAKIMRDITDRQRAIAERENLLEAERAARAEAERTSRLKDEFLATLSHELRTPLNAILGWTQVLKEGVHDPAELDQALEVIDRNTRLQAQLIEDLLDMSRIVSGKVRLTLRPVDVAEVVASAIESVRTLAETRRIRLESSLPGDGATLTADRHRLQQIVLNLLSNAIKFTPPEGRVAVVVEVTTEDVRILVRDTGVGISRDFLPHVFERFRQADASTTRRHGGLGLGLSIVKQLVELHGGSVQADSAGEGQGATFEISLPHTVDESPRSDAPMQRVDKSKSASRIDLRGVRVLVVDDEPDSAGLVKRVLESRHAEVRAAGSMHEALEIFSGFHPHILLSDIGMPHHDGYELIRRVRELPGGEIPAAALTALARRDDVDRALHAGFQTHVAKPVEPSELVTVTAGLAGIAPAGSDQLSP